MTEISAEFVPVLADEISFVRFSNDKFTICFDSENDTKLNISSVTKRLLDKVDGQRNLEELTAALNYDLGTKFKTEDILTVFKRQLVGYGIFSEDDSRKVKGKDNYLKMRFVILRASLVTILAGKLTFLFEKRFFFTSLIVGVLYTSLSFIIDLQLNMISSLVSMNFLYLFFILLALSILFHELGHAAACLKFGAKAGAIGFGFYLIFPAFYADVTDTWRLKRHQRIIVDLAGIYMQLLFSVALCIAFHVTGELSYLNLAFAIASMLIININPFLRYDGYWILSDLTNIPNLKDRAKLALRQVYLFLTNQNPTWKNDWETWFLTIYGILRVGFLVFFLLFMLIGRSNAIVMFPVSLYELLSTIFTDFGSVTFDWLKSTIPSLFVPMIFYILVFRLIKSKVEKVNFRRQQKEQLNLTERNNEEV